MLLSAVVACCWRVSFQFGLHVPPGVGFEGAPILSKDGLAYKFAGVRHSQVTLVAPPWVGVASPQKSIATFPMGPSGPTVFETVEYDILNFSSS